MNEKLAARLRVGLNGMGWVQQQRRQQLLCVARCYTAYSLCWPSRADGGVMKMKVAYEPQDPFHARLARLL